MSQLRIAPGVTLPLDAVTRTFGVLGQRGTGKTSAAVVMAEEMVTAGAHIAILDPVGVHWGITRPGTGRGLAGVVIGGEHADVPLEESGGQLVAELVVGRHWPIVVVDMKLMRKGAQRRFMADYLETLYFKNREPLHQFFEEADQALPQTPRGMDPTMGRVLGAGEDIVKLGRSRGLGATLISQRPATVNKNVLEQVESLFLFRLMGPRDRKSAREWIEANADPSKEREIMDSLSGLGLGECWLWSPAWLKLLRQIKVRQRKTFDSSATPEVGEKLAEPSSRAPIDLDVLRDRMAATIERAKAEDPRELRKQIAALKRELEQRPTEKQVETVTETVEIPVLDDAALERLEEAVEALSTSAGKIITATNEIGGALGKLKTRPTAPAAPQRPPARAAAPPPRPPARQAAAVADGDFRVTPAQQRILNALAMLEAIGATQPSKTQLALFAGASPKSSGYTNNLGALRTAGLIDYPAPGAAALTADGRQDADHTQAPGSHDEMMQFVRGLVGPAKARILDALVNVYPDALPKDELAARAGASASSSGYTNNLGSLRSLGLIDYPSPGYAGATAVLFLEAAA